MGEKLAADRASNKKFLEAIEKRDTSKRGKSWEKMLRESDNRRQRRNYSRSRSRDRRDYDRSSDSRRSRRGYERDRRPPRGPPSRTSHRDPPKRNYVPQAQQQESRRREYQNHSNP